MSLCLIVSVSLPNCLSVSLSLCLIVFYYLSIWFPYLFLSVSLPLSLSPFLSFYLSLSYFLKFLDIKYLFISWLRLSYPFRSSFAARPIPFQLRFSLLWTFDARVGLKKQRRHVSIRKKLQKNQNNKKSAISIVNWMQIATKRFTDLVKLNFLMVFNFRLELIYNTTPAASKNDAWFKSGQNWLENNHLASLI